MATSGHPWLAERFREHLVVKCQLMAKSGHPWLAERRKGDLGVRSNPNPNKRNVVGRKDDIFVKGHLNAKSGHPWLAERRKGDLVVKGLFEGKERPSFACGTS